MKAEQSSCSRREFLGRTTTAAASLAAVSAFSSMVPAREAQARAIGANDKINLAVIGIRSRGNALTKKFAAIPNVHIKTLCDIDGNLFPERVAWLEKNQGYAPATETDMRKVFDDKDIDAVVIATPNHWHALAAIWAMQAGKHVYLEKPCSHEIREGRKIIEAARKYDRLCQVGFQSRSKPGCQAAMKFMHEGGIGEVYMARVLCFKPRGSIGHCPDGPVPDGAPDFDFYIQDKKGPRYDAAYLKNVNYDAWLGPAPLRPFNSNRFHYNWHWFWETGNGDIGNNGPHDIDLGRWGLNKSDAPIKINSAGGYFAFDSDQQVPNTQIAVCEYADGKIMQIEVRGAYTNKEHDVAMGNLFYGSKGWLYLNDAKWESFLGRKNEPGPAYKEETGQKMDRMDLSGSGDEGHMINFINSLRSGKREDLNCDIEEGHRSCVIPHLANIAYRLGRTIRFDGASEKCIDDRDASALLTREYRKPFVVPDKV